MFPKKEQSQTPKGIGRGPLISRPVSRHTRQCPRTRRRCSRRPAPLIRVMYMLSLQRSLEVAHKEAHRALSPNSTTLLTRHGTSAAPMRTSWKIVNASVPVNALWIGDAVPGRLVYTSCHLHLVAE